MPVGNGSLRRELGYDRAGGGDKGRVMVPGYIPRVGAKVDVDGDVVLYVRGPKGGNNQARCEKRTLIMTLANKIK